MFADHGMMQRAVLQRHPEHLAARLFQGFLDRDRHFARLAFAHAHCAVAVANHGERSKAEDASAFHHLGDAVHRDHLLLQAVRALLAALHSGLHSRHRDSFRVLA